MRQVVSDAARDHPVLVLARELAGIRARVGVWGSVGIPLERDRRDLDRGRRRQSPLQLVVPRLPLSQAQPPDEPRELPAILVISGVAPLGRPQSTPPTIACRILSASMTTIISSARADCWPLRTVSAERKRVGP
jgi:hypothetical protein